MGLVGCSLVNITGVGLGKWIWVGSNLVWAWGVLLNWELGGRPAGSLGLGSPRLTFMDFKAGLRNCGHPKIDTADLTFTRKTAAILY